MPQTKLEPRQLQSDQIAAKPKPQYHQPVPYNLLPMANHRGGLAAFNYRCRCGANHPFLKRRYPGSCDELAQAIPWCDAARGKHFLDHPQTKRESKIEPDRVADNLGGEAMTTIERITRWFNGPKLPQNPLSSVNLAVPPRRHPHHAGRGAAAKRRFSWDVSSYLSANSGNAIERAQMLHPPRRPIRIG